MNSDIGHLKLNTETVNALWGEPIGFTTDMLGEHFPTLVKKVGKGKELTGFVKIKDVDIRFAKEQGTDVIVTYTFCYLLNLLENGKEAELIYDELQMLTSAQVAADDDILYITLHKHKHVTDNRYGQRSSPRRNSVGLSANEYREVISSFGFF